MLNRLVSFLRGEGLPGSCAAAAATAVAEAGVVKALALEGDEIAEVAEEG